jgi:hypothetical protein
MINRIGYSTMHVLDFMSVANTPEAANVLAELKREHPKIHSLIHANNNRKAIKLNVFYSVSSDSYMIMVQLVIDSVAMRLGASNRFPRGWPIIWTEREGFVFAGFFPKFKNDQKQVDNVKEFCGQLMYFMFKYSGFLGIVPVWKTNSTVYWTTTSKNSTNSDFSNDAARIIEDMGFMSDELAEKLWDEKLYYAGEVESFNDMTHGAELVSEAFICTCVGRIHTRDNPPDSDNIADTLSHTEMHETCLRLGIPVGEIITSTNPELVGQKLSEGRDYMTMTKMRKLLSELEAEGHVTIVHGTVRHEDVLGDTLEGLVIWIDSVVMKFKFPEYTSETFGLRAFLGCYSPRLLLAPAYKTHVDEFLDFWVITPKGREYWMIWLYAAAVLGSELPSEFFTAKTPKQVGSHIRLAQLTSKLTDEQRGELAAQFTEKIGLPPIQGKAHVCVIVGPIGSGKTSVGEWLALQMQSGVHIDGDKLYSIGDVELTMKLGKERTVSTLSQINRALTHGKTPIISCGGGVLFRGNSGASLMLKDHLLNTLGLELVLTTYIPSDRSELDDFYQSWSTHDVVNYRLDAGLWFTGKDRRKFLDDIQTQSRDNVKFAKGLVNYADEVITWTPLIYPNKTVHAELPCHPVCMPALQKLSYSQFRILVAFNLGKTDKDWATGHITMDYTPSLKAVFIDQFEEMRTTVQGLQQLGGLLVQYKKGCSFVVFNEKSAMQIVDVGQSLSKRFQSDHRKIHVTVAPGKHEPAMMAQACLQFNTNMDKSKGIDIPDKNGEIQHYENPSVSPVPIHVLDLIYL